MKKYLLYKALYALFLFVTLSCTSYEEIEFMDHTPLLVVNSVAEPGSPFKVQVSATKSLNEVHPYLLINNARVELYQDGTLLETLLHQEKGMYQSTQTKPLEGKTYQFKVAAPGYTPCQASYTQPVAAELGSRKFSWIRDEQGYPMLQGEIQLIDPAGQDDFYYARIYVLDSVYDFSTGRKVERRSYVSLELPQHPREWGMDNEMLIRDVTFNGKINVLQLRFYPRSGYRHFIEIGRTTEAYYRYARTYHYNGAEMILSSPRQVYNNVSGGVGIVAGRSANMFSVRIR